MAYSNVAQLRMLSSDIEGTRTWSSRTLDLLAELPPGTKHTEVMVHALNNLGSSELSAGDPVEGLQMLTTSLEQARAADLHEHAARAYCNLLDLAVVQRRHADADAVVQAGLEYCVDRDLDSWTRYLQGWQAQLELDRGNYARALEVSSEVLRQVEVEPVGLVEPLLVVALVEARTGQSNGSESLERAARIAEGTGEVQRLGPLLALSWPGSPGTSKRPPRRPLRYGRWSVTPTAAGTAAQSPPGSTPRPPARSIRTRWRRRSPSRCAAGGERPPSCGRPWTARTSRPWPWPAVASRMRWSSQWAASKLWARRRPRTGRESCSGPTAGRLRGVRGPLRAVIRAD